MLVFLGVENFAKIESAKICINSYTLLVGPNNSGKTYFMQLVQGVNERLVDLLDEKGMQILQCSKDTASDRDSDTEDAGYMISKDNILQFTEYLNEKLDENKEQIVREIFGREVPTGKIYVEFCLEAEEKYEVIFSEHLDKINKILSLTGSMLSLPANLLVSAADGALSDSFAGRKAYILKKYSEEKKKGEVVSLSVRSAKEEMDSIKSMLRNIFECDSLFFPASRTGIMLLYREFFANKADDMFSYQVKENQLVEKKNYGELTRPVYQFLRFLQTYSENEVSRRIYNKEIDFFEEKLIEGHISANKQNGFSYDSKTDHVSVPVYMASSMINEIAPLVLALTSMDLFGRFIIDEIEASLHPRKQLDLVRFLNRLSNQGIRLILSTHSDTFASKVSNLYILSNYVKQDNGDDAMKKLGLEREDLIDSERLFVYEFINQPDGKSIVKEIPGNSETGFQFDLFTDSAMHLYNEALKIGEILQNDQA